MVHPPGLSSPEISNLLYVKTDEKYFFFQGSPSKERVLRFAITPSNTRERLGVPSMGAGIIRHSDANHVSKARVLSPALRISSQVQAFGTTISSAPLGIS